MKGSSSHSTAVCGRCYDDMFSVKWRRKLYTQSTDFSLVFVVVVDPSTWNRVSRHRWQHSTHNETHYCHNWSKSVNINAVLESHNYLRLLHWRIVSLIIAKRLPVVPHQGPPRSCSLSPQGLHTGWRLNCVLTVSLFPAAVSRPKDSLQVKGYRCPGCKFPAIAVSTTVYRCPDCKFPAIALSMTVYRCPDSKFLATAVSTLTDC